ncbi:hypothetical protein AGMMS50230_15370 [Spirochaetia bacterium]|nr:hypothetical protein AGMMS50230_15370 [Spirochaetia bacterium]
MKCTDAMDTIYETDELPLTRRLSLAIHIVFCGRCSARLERYEEARSILGAGFPPSPDFSGAIMSRICLEADESFDEEAYGFSGGFSTRGWVAAGLILLFSLPVLFFGKDFAHVVLVYGSSYLLPLGIIIGVVITGYGALFIGSHLKELSDRFKL